MEIPFSNRGKTKLLSRLKNTKIESPTNEQVLEYSASTNKWINSSSGIFQDPLDMPVVSSPSGTGNLTLTNGTLVNNLLTYTPTDKNNISGNATFANNITITPGSGDLITPGVALSTGAKIKSATSASIGAISVPPGGTASNLQAVSTTSTTSTSLASCDSLTIAGALATGTLTCITTITCSFLTVAGFGFGNTINWAGQPIWLQVSDSRLKWNQQPIINGLEKIMKLKPKTYDATHKILDEKPDDTKKSAGFIAQDIKEIPDFKDFVRGDLYDDNNKPTPLRLDYGAIFTHNISAIQELNNELILEDKKIAKLYEKINNIMIKIK